VTKAEDRYQEVIDAFEGDRSVTQSSRETGSRSGFGATALRTGGKIFAMLTPRGTFVVKLPRSRVDDLVAAGRGARFEAGRARPMKEWFEVSSRTRLDWVELAREAREFVSAR
jgi:hypothetical protein